MSLMAENFSRDVFMKNMPALAVQWIKQIPTKTLLISQVASLIQKRALPEIPQEVKAVAHGPDAIVLYQRGSTTTSFPRE